MLLCDATFYGTLAATRCLGRAGVPVIIFDSVRVAPVLWSRYVTRRERCPNATNVDAFVEWLVRFGRREPRHVLYPTSDELAFLLSAHRELLSESFALYQPDLETMVRVLDKRRLIETAGAQGIKVPDTWFPETAADVERAAREAEGPLMIKPRTQIFLKNHRKGAVASRDPRLLREEYERFCREHRYGELVARDRPELTRPMLQRYYPGAAEWIYSITGFCDAEGRCLPVLGAAKVLQFPRKIGVGLCFEAAPVEDALREKVARLMKALGYYGVFEIEFIRSGDRLLLIDMNPRFYNQLALDVARGLLLPRLAYAAALGRGDEVARLARETPAEADRNAFCNRLGLRMLVGAQRLFGTMTPAEAHRWQNWAREPGRSPVDSAGAEDDPVPMYVDAAAQIYGCLRHPRYFVRKIALDR